jgi:UDP:flavonoid glycosyltransferase YjiC (YdhE family)
MRLLVATTAGAGHFGPLVPFASACAAAGHEVRVAAPVSFADLVRRAGFIHVPVADADPAELGAIFGTLPGLSFEEANKRVMRDVFAGVDARAVLPGLTAAVRDWRPDLILRETTEYASYVVAECEDIPTATVAIGLAQMDDFTYAILDGALEELGSHRGVGGLRDALTLSTVPVSLERPGEGERTVRFRDNAMVAPSTELPNWWPGQPTPLVYVSFGTVAGGMELFPGLYQGVIDALAGEPVRVLVTVGESGDPGALGPLPPNVHVERFWPQAEVMTSAAATVGHGGFGTTMLSLAAGVPLAVIPLFALDQHFNAAAVTRRGAGVTVDGSAQAVGDLAGAIRGLLETASYREVARQVADEVAYLPAIPDAVPILVDLSQT